MTPEETLARLERIQYLRGYQWTRFARPDQIAPPPPWLIWLILAGRGWGKTRTGAEWIKDQALANPGTRWAVVAPTYADARDTCIEGESGLQAILPDDRIQAWNRSLGELVLVNGSRVKLFSADEPERLRGPQHHGAWCDELAAWRYPDTWDQLQFGLRLGESPATVVTTTPKPVRLVRELVKRPDVVVTRGSTFDNAANLSEAALSELRLRYEGTRIGRQELHAELLDDVPGALWVPSMFEVERFRVGPGIEDCSRVVVAIDPAVTSSDESDETGMITAGVTDEGYCPACGVIEGRHVMVLEDSSCRLTPDGWARRAVDVYDRHGGDLIVAEVNNGGDLVESVLRTVDASLPYEKVTASRGKRVRAEPIAALYEQGRVHHVGVLAELEQQMVEWTPDAAKSPDRLDALVWAVWALMFAKQSKRRSVKAA